MSGEIGDITMNLKQWLAGSKEAEDKLYEMVFPKLRDLAHAIMSRERRGHTVQAMPLSARIEPVYLRDHCSPSNCRARSAASLISGSGS